jgi:hypothetical protein
MIERLYAVEDDVVAVLEDVRRRGRVDDHARARLATGEADEGTGEHERKGKTLHGRELYHDREFWG